MTDITSIKPHEGWLYLCVVIDLFFRHVVGWSVVSRMTTGLALQALLMAAWRRKLDGGVSVRGNVRSAGQSVLHPQVAAETIARRMLSIPVTLVISFLIDKV